MARQRGCGEGRGFTLVEIMAVLMIVSILLLAIVPNLDNMVPAYRLIGGARSIAGTIELAQGEAIGRRAELAIAYDLDANSYWLILPPEEEEEEERDRDDFGDLGFDDRGTPEGQTPRPQDDVEHGLAPALPSDEAQAPTDWTVRDALRPERLPRDVAFEAILVGSEERRSGRVYVTFSHQGEAGAHTVGLKLVQQQGDEGERLWIRFNPLTRTIEYLDERPQVRTLPGEDGR